MEAGDSAPKSGETFLRVEQVGIAHAVDHLLTLCMAGMQIGVGDGDAFMPGQIAGNSSTADGIAVHVRGEGVAEFVDAGCNSDIALLCSERLPWVLPLALRWRYP